LEDLSSSRVEEPEMPSLSTDLLRTALALKINRIKLAGRAYLRDQAVHGRRIAVHYAVSAGLFAVAAIFLIASILVGLAALFRWLEIAYGQFWAFGGIGALLLAMAAICAGAAATAPSSPNVPSLTSRLRVAIKSGPRQPDRVQVARNNAAEVLRASPVPAADGRNGRRPFSVKPHQVGLLLTAVVLGVAMSRRQRKMRKSPAQG
jgi:hypothetical protein